MLALIAAILFAAAFALSIGTIAVMLVRYRDKMMAALLFEPIPRESTTYVVRP